MPDSVLDGWDTAMNKWTKKPNSHGLSIQLAGEIGDKPLAIDILNKKIICTKEGAKGYRKTNGGSGCQRRGKQGRPGWESGVRAG